MVCKFSSGDCVQFDPDVTDNPQLKGRRGTVISGMEDEGAGCLYSVRVEGIGLATEVPANWIYIVTDE